MPPEALPTDLEEQAARYRALLADKRALVVLDNVSSAEQVRPLLPGSSLCLVLITSRDRLLGLVATEGARLVPLDVLASEEAIGLLAGVIGHDRVGAEAEAAAKVAQLCGYLPLAVRIAAARLAARPTMSIATFAERLADEQHRLRELKAGDCEVRASFALSYEDLEPVSARMFRLLGLIPGSDFTADVAAALADTTPSEAELLLEMLVDAHLVEVAPIPERYRFHDLLRLYARERLETEESDDDRRGAVLRMLVWYLDTATAADRLLAPWRGHLLLERQGELSPLMTKRAEALAWFETERASLVAATHRAAALDLHGIAARIPAALGTFLYIRKHWSDWQNTCRVGITSARQVHDRQAEAWLLLELGSCNAELRRFEDAMAY